LRALRAGYRAVIAQDAFIHHFGGQTFRGSGVDFAGLMRRNEELFRAKWRGEGSTPPATGPAAAAGSLPQPAPFAVRRAPGGGLLLTRQAIRISLCLIVRDSVRTIAACLESSPPWVDEL